MKCDQWFLFLSDDEEFRSPMARSRIPCSAAEKPSAHRMNSSLRFDE
jgi:hypothetical protein